MSFDSVKADMERNKKSEAEKPDALDRQFGGTHYKGMGIEPVQYIEANGINFTLGSAIKYISRHAVKNGAIDLKKAIHFIAMDLERVYGVKTEFYFSDDNPRPAESISELHKSRDGWMHEYNRKAERLEQIETELRALRNAVNKDVWYYQGDGEDYPESLTCNVVMSADMLRKLLGDAGKTTPVSPTPSQPVKKSESLAKLDPLTPKNIRS